ASLSATGRCGGVPRHLASGFGLKMVSRVRWRFSRPASAHAGKRCRYEAANGLEREAANHQLERAVVGPGPRQARALGRALQPTVRQWNPPHPAGALLLARGIRQGDAARGLEDIRRLVTRPPWHRSERRGTARSGPATRPALSRAAVRRDAARRAALLLRQSLVRTRRWTVPVLPDSTVASLAHRRYRVGVLFGVDADI